MEEGQPTRDQMYKIIGSIYTDAYLRIKFLENENKTLREDHQRVVDGLLASRDDALRKLEEIQKCNSGKGNSMLLESLRAKANSGLAAKQCVSSDQPDCNVTPPPKSIETPEKKLP